MLYFTSWSITTYCMICIIHYAWEIYLHSKRNILFSVMKPCFSSFIIFSSEQNLSLMYWFNFLHISIQNTIYNFSFRFAIRKSLPLWADLYKKLSHHFPCKWTSCGWLLFSQSWSLCSGEYDASKRILRLRSIFRQPFCIPTK